MSEEYQDRILEMLDKLLEQQREMHDVAERLNETMAASTRATSGIVSQMIKVPVACVVVCAASWAFMYLGKISETNWMIIMAVAVFPWLGDSITAIAGLIRGRDAK